MSMTMPEAAVAGDAAWDECAALLYHDFASFAARAFGELNPRTPLAMNWHVELIAAKLAATMSLLLWTAVVAGGRMIAFI